MPQRDDQRFIRRRIDSENGWRNLGVIAKDITWDPKPREPAGGFPAVKMPKPCPGANWDDATWPATEIPRGDTMAKGKGMRTYMLRDVDIVDLCYSVSVATIRKKEYPHPLQKNYLCTQLERRAWEKYGGPTGFEQALAKRDARAAAKRAPVPPAHVADPPGPPPGPPPVQEPHVHHVEPTVNGFAFNILDYGLGPVFEHFDIALYDYPTPSSSPTPEPYVEPQAINPPPPAPIPIARNGMPQSLDAPRKISQKKTIPPPGASSYLERKPAKKVIGPQKFKHDIAEPDLEFPLGILEPVSSTVKKQEKDIIDLTMEDDSDNPSTARVSPTKSTLSCGQKRKKEISSDDDDEVVIVSFTPKKESVSRQKKIKMGI